MNQNSLLQSYPEQPHVWNEMFSAGKIRSPYKNFVSVIEDLLPAEMTHTDEMDKTLFMSHVLLLLFTMVERF